MDIVAIAVILLLFVAGPVIVVNRDLLFNRSAARRAPYEAPLPFLIIPSFPGATDIVPAGVPRWREASRAQAVVEPPAAQVEEPRGAPLRTNVQEPVQHADQRLEWTRPTAWEDSDEPSPDATVIFHRPVDEPVQILPGRLHVLTGDAAGEDLRLFSRIGEPAQIVVGRDAGPAYQHITLRSPTVSRRHARIEFVNGSWTITNLSATNPVLVNDRVLSNGSTTRKLSDGDRIELGEVALRFLAS